ncbi:MAG TPA: acyl-CoA dehydrogenase family protein, partial [Dehalococcoidia bacterium]
MNAGFTPEQEQMRRTVREFATRELLPRYTHWDRTGEFPTDIWRQMGRIGLCGTRVPDEYGGQDLPAVTTGLIAEEVARGDFNCSYAVLMTALCGEVMRGHAGPRVREEWMRPMADGTAVIGLALTEPGSGSDAKAMRSVAKRDGDDYV